MKALVEVVVQIQSFRNLDLLNQGLYQIQISLSTSEVTARPLSFDSIPIGRERHLKFNPHKISEGHLLDYSNSARSRVFMIRYNEEQVKLDDVATFLMQIPIAKLDSQLNVSVSLLYLKIASAQGSAKDYSAFQQINLLPVAHLNIQASKFTSGLHSYLPVQFKGQWNCAVDAVIHAITFDYNSLSDLTESMRDAKAHTIDLMYGQVITPLGETYESIRAQIHALQYLDSSIEAPPLLKLPLNADHEALQSFSDVIGQCAPEEVAALVSAEVRKVSHKMHASFQLLRKLLSQYSRSATKHFAGAYSQALSSRYGHFEVAPGGNHLERAAELRRAPYLVHLPYPQVYRENMFPPAGVHPVLFTELLEQGALPRPRGPEVFRMRDIHVIVLVHGFQGFASDMRGIKFCISAAHPKSFFIESSFNELRTDESIEEMGFRLAKEVISALSEISSGEIPNISFIGYSLGGLVARAALPHLACLSDRMHSFLSLSSPHLGMVKARSWVDAGMWVLKKFRNSDSLRQLSLEDFGFKEGTFIYRLSQARGFEWFRHIMFVGSSQDSYVPFESARVEMASFRQDSEIAEVCEKMVYNIMSRIDPAKLIKVDAIFKLKASVDSIIGRSAHIQLIENEDFIRMLVYRYPQIFGQSLACLGYNVFKLRDE